MEDKLLEDLFNAYYSARKNKRNTINALKFELSYEKKLFELFEEIVKRRYNISKSICFINFQPIQREIFAADFRDRIVHHLVYNYTNHFFEKSFVNDSYSCRKGKGTHYGIKRINRFISQCSSNYNKDCWIMKLDIEGYFMKMDRDILYDRVMKIINANKEKIYYYDLTKYLIQKIIFNDPRNNCYIKGNKKDWEGLPESKSLFSAEENKGLPIGNLTSQLFGNVYLNEMDHFIKEKLGIKYYGRYVDDFVLIHSSKEYLLNCRQKISDFLRSKLELNLHPKKFYLQHYQKGVQFLGVLIKPYRIYIGKRVKRNLYSKIDFWNEVIDSNKGNLSSEEKHLFRSQINSYLGLMKHYNTYKLRKKILEIDLDNYFSEYFEFPLSYEKTIMISG